MYPRLVGDWTQEMRAGSDQSMKIIITAVVVVAASLVDVVKTSIELKRIGVPLHPQVHSLLYRQLPLYVFQQN